MTAPNAESPIPRKKALKEKGFRVGASVTLSVLVTSCKQLSNWMLFVIMPTASSILVSSWLLYVDATFSADDSRSLFITVGGFSFDEDLSEELVSWIAFILAALLYSV
jgi:hypothetical protein